MKDDGEPKRACSTPPNIATLAILRLIIGAGCIGFGIATLIMLLIGTIRALSGNLDSLHGSLGLFATTFAWMGASTFVIPRMERRMLSLANVEPSENLLIPLYSALSLYPFGKIKPNLENALVKSLNEVDAEWWRKNRRTINHYAKENMNSAVEEWANGAPRGCRTWAH